MTDSELIALGKMLESTGYDGTFDARVRIWKEATYVDKGICSRLTDISIDGPYYWAIATVYLKAGDS